MIFKIELQGTMVIGKGLLLMRRIMANMKDIMISNLIIETMIEIALFVTIERKKIITAS